MITFERLLIPLPDVEGLVHGIVSVHPPKVQCDGCGLVATGGRLTLTIMFCGIYFRRGDSSQRLCDDCAGGTR